MTDWRTIWLCARVNFSKWAVTPEYIRLQRSLQLTQSGSTRGFLTMHLLLAFT